MVDEQRTAQNARVQIFDQNGTFIEQWNNIGLELPTGIAIAGDDTVYIGDMNGNSITILKDGRIIDVIGDQQARPHNLALDAGTEALGTGADRAPGGMFKQVIKKN